MNKLEDSLFIQEICQRLDASIAHLDPSISARLNTSRQDALKNKRQPINAETDSLAQKVREQLNENAGLSIEIEAKLNQIRQQAIARLNSTELRVAPSSFARLQNCLESRFSTFSLAVPGAMLATACVLVTVVSIFYVTSRPAGSLSLEEEISLIASAEDIELYENLEFYLWLAENEALTL